jgi:hypothetical protein
MKLPGGEHAIVDIAKLQDYCLYPLHSRGRHKARVFMSALGLSRADAEYLRDELFRALAKRTRPWVTSMNTPSGTPSISSLQGMFAGR